MVARSERESHDFLFAHPLSIFAVYALSFFTHTGTLHFVAGDFLFACWVEFKTSKQNRHEFPEHSASDQQGQFLPAEVARNPIIEYCNLLAS